MDLNWTCPACGPIEDALPGDPGEFHCSGLECDERVEMIPLCERPKTAMKKAYPDQKKGRPPKSKAENERRAIAEGREILERMNNRAKGKPKPKKESDVAKSRHGKCSTCEQDKWLLRADPPTCAKCYRAVNPPQRKKKVEVEVRPTKVKEAKPEPTVESKPKKKRKKRRPNKKKVQVDDLRLECGAIENVSRGLEGLNPQAVERVLTYVLTRMSQRNELGAEGSIKVGLLPAPR